MRVADASAQQFVAASSTASADAPPSLRILTDSLLPPTSPSFFPRRSSTMSPVVDSFQTMQLNYLKGSRVSESSAIKMLSFLKAMAQCHVVLGIAMLILSSLADYMSSRSGTIRLNGLEECCSFYFIVTGIVGLCGAASYRRGLVITFMVMSIHAVLIFVPAIVIVSSFDIHFYQHECWGECDWHLLATSLPVNSRCQILCGEHVDDNMRSSMTRLGTDYRLDAGLIAAACLEFFLSIFTAALAARTICFPPKTNTVEMVPMQQASATATASEPLITAPPSS